MHIDFSCDFSFHFLNLVVSEILGDPKITLGAMRKKFYTRREYFVISNCVSNFDFLALVLSEILGVPNLS